METRAQYDITRHQKSEPEQPSLPVALKALLTSYGFFPKEGHNDGVFSSLHGETKAYRIDIVIERVK